MFTASLSRYFHRVDNDRHMRPKAISFKLSYSLICLALNDASAAVSPAKSFTLISSCSIDGNTTP